MMKRFLKYCLLFILPIILIGTYMEWMIRQVPNPYKYKYEWMNKNADEVEILILGNSHTFYGIRPEFFSCKSFNLANVSQDLKTDFFLMKYWADRYKHLNTIIIPISSYTWFGEGMEYSEESYRCRFYNIYMDCNIYSSCFLNNLELSDLRTAKGKLEKLFMNETETGCDVYGWGNTHILSDKDNATWNDGTEAEIAVKRHTAKSLDNIKTNFEQMKKIALFCIRRNIQLVLITTPCWSTYYDNLEPNQLKKMYELNHYFTNKFGIPYLDYLKDPRFNEDDFHDSNHLSEFGAKKFSEILDDDLMKLKKNKYDSEL